MKRIKLTLKLKEDSINKLNQISTISGKSRTAIIEELINNYGEAAITSVKTLDVSGSNSRPT